MLYEVITYNIYYAGTTTDFNYSDGKLMAYKNLRDGNAPDNIGMPYLLGNLNTLARSMAREFNNIHSTGYTKPDGVTPSQTGINFFNLPAGGYGDVTAGNLALSADVLSSVRNIAASSVAVTSYNFV